MLEHEYRRFFGSPAQQKNRSPGSRFAPFRFPRPAVAECPSPIRLIGFEPDSRRIDPAAGAGSAYHLAINCQAVRLESDQSDWVGSISRSIPNRLIGFLPIAGLIWQRAIRRQPSAWIPTKSRRYSSIAVLTNLLATEFRRYRRPRLPWILSVCRSGRRRDPAEIE
jgi:hypothetical protein